MGAEPHHREHTVAAPYPHRVESARVGPLPVAAVDMGVAEDPRDAGASRRGKQHPAAIRPFGLADRRIGSVGRVGGRVLHHLRLVHHRPFFEVVDRPDVGRGEAQPVEAPAVEGAVLVEEGRQRLELVVLDGDQLVARAGLQRLRPVLVARRGIHIAAVALERLQPDPPGPVLHRRITLSAGWRRATRRPSRRSRRRCRFACPSGRPAPARAGRRARY